MESPGKHRIAPNAAGDAVSASKRAVERSSERFPKTSRLHSRNDFDELFNRGKVIVDQMLVVHGRVATQRGRIGISISKRVGHAPLRNRWKRLIRESYRRLYARVPALSRVDLVVRPRRGAVPSYPAIERSLSQLATRLDRQLNRSQNTQPPANPSEGPTGETSPQ